MTNPLNLNKIESPELGTIYSVIGIIGQAMLRNDKIKTPEMDGEELVLELSGSICQRFTEYLVSRDKIKDFTDFCFNEMKTPPVAVVDINSEK